MKKKLLEIDGFKREIRLVIFFIFFNGVIKFTEYIYKISRNKITKYHGMELTFVYCKKLFTKRMKLIQN